MTTLSLTVPNVKLITLSCCILHNLLIERKVDEEIGDRFNMRGDLITGNWRNDTSLVGLPNNRSKSLSIRAQETRLAFVDYFSGPGLL